jgi:uncharacterized protein YjlB
MHEIDAEVVAAEVILPGSPLDATVAFFVDRLGFRVDAVRPADDPAVTVVSGHGLRLRLDRSVAGEPGRIRLRVAGDQHETLSAPNGTVVELVPDRPPVRLPPLKAAFTVSRVAGAGGWGTGRAGMQYRDLLPGRLGGRVVASHIGIPDGGPVPDYVHFHRIRFQMIFCHRGWVRVVYEDQGEPFVLEAGDCVLQPPEIRHRVLEASPGLEVVEIGSPAEHDTLADHGLALPTGALQPERSFFGQRFVRHRASTATWVAEGPGVEARDTGIGAATGGLAQVHLVRGPLAATPAGELWCAFVRAGSAVLRRDGHVEGDRLVEGDCVSVPAGTGVTFDDVSADFEVLRVEIPAAASGPVPEHP